MKIDVSELDFSLVMASSVHDMKNSITLLLAALDEITQQCQPDHCKCNTKFVLMQHEGQRLTRHLVQLLTLYRLDKSQYFPNVGENNLKELYEEIAMDSELLLNAQGIQIELDCEEDVSGFFDRELIGGVINTIVNNAYRYARNTIRLSACNAGGFLVLSVEDDGPGYPPNMLLSSSYESRSINFSTGGTGLGLYFAYRVAIMHSNNGKHGQIKISNEGINNGGKFSLYLP